MLHRYCFGFGLVNSTFDMLWRPVDRIKPQRFRSGIDHIVLGTRWYDDTVIGPNLIGHITDPGLAASHFKTEKLIAIFVNLFANFFARFGRIRAQYEEGTIPGAISVPYTEAADRLGEFGCEIDFDGWICEAELPDVVLFCNGPWCGQSPTAARRMIEAGYPAERIYYYRGGMQSCNMLGLTVMPSAS